MTHPSADLYGSDRMVIETLQACCEAGDDTWFAVPAGPLLELLPGNVSRVPNQTFKLEKSIFRSWRILCLPLRFIIDLFRDVRLIHNLKVDCVIVNTIIQPGWLFAAKVAGVPVVCHVREAETQLSRTVGQLLTLPLLWANALIANSESTLLWITWCHARLKSKTTVIYNGKSWPCATRQVKPEAESALRLVVVGRISPRKGQDIAIKSLALLKGRGVSAHLTIAGDTFPGYEWYVDELTRLSKDLGVDSEVSYVGFVSDVATLLQSSEILIVPSRVEPFGSVAVEGLAVGVPTVVSNVGGLPETIGVDSGWLFEADDPHSLAATLERVIVDRAETEKRVTAGLLRIESLFSLPQYRNQITTLIETVVEGAPV